MTLVVGRKAKGELLLVADTQINDPKVGSVLAEQRLKIAFLNPGTAIAYAGEPDVAEHDVLQFLARRQSAGFTDTLRYFEKASSNSINAYLLGFAGPRRLFRIENGKSIERLNAWAGAEGSFEAYQSGPDPSTLDTAPWTMTIIESLPQHNEIVEAIGKLRVVIEAHGQPDVGGFFLAAGTQNGVWQVPGIVTMVSQPALVEGHIAFGPLAGDPSYRLCILSAEGVPLSAALYAFPGAGKGFLFLPVAPGGFGRFRQVLSGGSLKELAKGALELSGLRFVEMDASLERSL